MFHFQTSLVFEKKDNFQYSEKFSHHRVAPSVKSFGGRPLEGCLVVSATGMVGIIVLGRDLQNITLHSVSESLGTMRNRITSADICYGKSKFLLLYLLLLLLLEIPNFLELYDFTLIGPKYSFKELNAN